jgi:heme-degrading monooxygenase HmoA
MIVTCNRIPVNPEYADAFETRFADRAGQVDGMPGFVSFQLLRPKAAGDPYIVMTFWESDEAFQNWTQSAAFSEGHGRSGTLPPQAFAGRPTLEIYDVIQRTGKD